MISRFEKLESTKERTERWVEERLDRHRARPDDQTWSLCQVIDHVMQAEGGSLRYVQKKLGDPSMLKRGGARAVMRSIMLGIALRSPLRFKAPTVVESPSNELEWAGQKAAWDEIRRGWRTLLESYPAEHVETAIYRHPVAGRLTIAQTVAFMQEHLDHHRRQLLRIDERLRQKAS